jgi:hypothetical protein
VEYFKKKNVILTAIVLTLMKMMENARDFVKIMRMTVSVVLQKKSIVIKPISAMIKMQKLVLAQNSAKKKEIITAYVVHLQYQNV